MAVGFTFQPVKVSLLKRIEVRDKVDLFKDIAAIMKNDKEHHLKIVVEQYEVSVYLEYDPEQEYNEKIVIPIKFTTVEEFAYIPDDEYRKMFNPNDFGIDKTEIKLIYEIMDYLEKHGKEICEICDKYNWENRLKTYIINKEKSYC